MDISSLGITGVAVITVICFLVGQVVKATGLDNKWIPIICGAFGAVLGILGMFIIGALVERWVSISFTPVVSQITQQDGAYIDWANLPAGSEGIKQALTQYASLGVNGLDQVKTTTLQGNLDQLIPGLAAVCLTLGCCKLLKKNVSPIAIILGLFAIGIIGRVVGFM